MTEQPSATADGQAQAKPKEMTLSSKTQPSLQGPDLAASPPIKIERPNHEQANIKVPTVEKPQNKKSTALFDNFNFDKVKKSEPAPLPKTISTAPNIKIEHKKNKKSLEILKRGREYTIQEIKDIFAKNNAPTKFDHQSKGYISLMNYLNDKGKGGMQSYGGKGRFPKGKRGNDVASFVVKNDDRYVPASMMKVAEVWDDTSDEAIQANVNFHLNRLTAPKLEKTLKDFEQHITDDHHRQIFADTLIEKAMKESTFSILYAQLTKKIPDTELQNMILRMANEKMEDWALNFPTTEEESTEAIGCARFFAGLILEHAVDFEEGDEILGKLLRKINATLDTYVIEMLEKFITTAGEEYANHISNEHWSLFDGILEKEGTRSRKGCLLLNIKDAREMWVHKAVQAKASTAVIETRDDLSSRIREWFCDFLDSSKLSGNGVNAPDFIKGGLSALPDYVKDYKGYAVFLGATARSLSGDRPNANVARDAFISSLREAEASNVVKDCPKIYTALFACVCGLLMHGLLSFSAAEEVYEHFPEGRPEVSWENELKYFIFDVHDFQQPIRVESRSLSNEIRDALLMPEAIEKRGERSQLSRLVAVAVCRVAVNRICAELDKVDAMEEPEKGLDRRRSEEAVRQVRGALLGVIRRMEKVFREEFEPAIVDFNIPLTCEDIVSIVNKR